MDCPDCGYRMDPLDKHCKRCMNIELHPAQTRKPRARRIPTTPDERAWGAQVHEEMRVTTLMARRNRALESGVDLVIISSHSSSCPLCKPWENKVVSLTGFTKGYPTWNEAVDAGYSHPGCGHTETPYYPEDAEVPD